MRIQGDLTIGKKKYQKGDSIPWYKVYPFFLVHMGGFGLSGFAMAYMDDGPNLLFLFLHGGFACFVYLVFYLALFGVDKVRWMLINAALGLFGIYAQIGWILEIFGKDVSDYAAIRHVIPFFYYVLYTFLLHQAVLQMTGASNDPGRRKVVDRVYVGASVAAYGSIWLAQN